MLRKNFDFKKNLVEKKLCEKKKLRKQESREKNLCQEIKSSCEKIRLGEKNSCRNKF